MTRYLADLQIKYALSGIGRPTSPDFLTWDKIEKIALVIGSGATISKSGIDRFIDGTGKFVEVHYVEIESGVHSYSDWQCYSKKESSVLKLPKKALVKEIAGRKYDVAINAGSGHDRFAETLLRAINAPMKCSYNIRHSFADLIIRMEKPYNIEDYLRNIVKYLKMIRK